MSCENQVDSANTMNIVIPKIPAHSYVAIWSSVLNYTRYANYVTAGSHFSICEFQWWHGRNEIS